MKPISSQNMDLSMRLLEAQLRERNSPRLSIVICGGSALIATNLVSRTTKDVDIVAFLDSDVLLDPNPILLALEESIAVVAHLLKLPSDWLYSDLLALNPNSEEMLQAALWSMSHDVSEGFRYLLKSLLTQLGFADVADRI